MVDVSGATLEDPPAAIGHGEEEGEEEEEEGHRGMPGSGHRGAKWATMAS